MNTRRAFILGGVGVAAGGAVAVLSAGEADAVSLGPYGSGYSNWSPAASYTRSKSAVSTFTAARDRDGIAQFGASIDRQAQYDLATRLEADHGLILAVDNWDARPTYAALDSMQEIETTIGLPRRVLIDSANDIVDPTGIPAAVDRCMSIVGSGRTVYWMEVFVSRTSSSYIQNRPYDGINSGQINHHLWQKTLQYPNLVIIGWTTALLGVSLWRQQNYLSDGVHLTTSTPSATSNGVTVRRAMWLSGMGLIG